MKLAAFIIALCFPQIATAGPDVTRGVHQPLTYMVDGVSMVVACFCDLEEEKVFEIGIDTPFENLPQASSAALGYAARICVAKGYTNVDPAQFDVGFYSSNTIPHELSYGGVCQ